MNGPVFVAAVIDRQNWTSKNSMVGHTNIVEVTVSACLSLSILCTNPELCSMLGFQSSYLPPRSKGSTGRTKSLCHTGTFGEK